MLAHQRPGYRRSARFHGQDLQQPPGDGGEVAGFGSQSLEASFEQTERVVERVIHDPHTGGAGGQSGETLRLSFELEQAALVEGRSSGKIS